MTLAAYTGPDTFNGDGSTTTFASTFIFWDADDLKVIERTIASGAETTLIRGTHYTVTGGSGAVGNVVAVTSPTDYTPSSAVQWIIKSNLSNLQDTQFPLGGPFPSTSAEDQNDKTVRLIQQLREILDRAALLVESTPTSGPLTMPEPSADDVLGWNAGGTDLENKTPNTDTHLTLPAASTDNGVVRYDGATGKAFQDSGVTIDDSDNVVIPGTLGVTGNTTLTGSLTVNNRVIWKKGADIASASPLVLGTDGNYFDVTGTTNFAAITVSAGTLFMLQFDGALTMTHGASLDLPGEANITTAAGDRLIGFAEAADTVQVLSYFKADGTPLIIGANTIDGTHIAMGSDAQGDVYYYDGTNVVRLAPGTSGQFLKTLGAGANPAWGAAGGFSSGCRAILTGDQTGIVSTVWTKVLYATEDYDGDGEFASNKFTAVTAGRYLVNMSVVYDTTVDNTQVFNAIYKNGSAVIFDMQLVRGIGAQIMNTVAILALAATDYIEGYVRQDSGANRTITASTTQTFFSVQRLF